MDRNYTQINAEAINQWVDEGWEWGQSIAHDVYTRAQAGDWSVLLTPVKPVPREWFPDMRGARVLGLACGGGQQMPIFAAAGAVCTVLDYSERQLEAERKVSQREGYSIEIVHADMTQPLPFADNQFDLIFHPVSNCYIEHVRPVWKECARVLRRGGILLAGLDNGISYAFDEETGQLVRSLPFNPLHDEALFEQSVREDWGIQFSHSIDEQVGGQLEAGLTLTHIMEDTDGSSILHKHGVPAFNITRSVKL